MAIRDIKAELEKDTKIDPNIERQYDFVDTSSLHIAPASSLCSHPCFCIRPGFQDCGRCAATPVRGHFQRCPSSCCALVNFPESQCPPPPPFYGRMHPYSLALSRSLSLSTPSLSTLLNRAQDAQLAVACQKLCDNMAKTDTAIR